MILDRENAFSQSQALTGTTLVASTDVIDLSQVRQVGMGNSLPEIVLNFEAAPGGTTPTITVASAGISPSRSIAAFTFSIRFTGRTIA